jgi:hypothetical protein
MNRSMRYTSPQRLYRSGLTLVMILAVSLVLLMSGGSNAKAGEHGPSPLQQGTLQPLWKTTETQVPDPTAEVREAVLRQADLSLSAYTPGDPAYDGTLVTVDTDTTGAAAPAGVDTRTSKCFYITATARYKAPVGTLWTFTSRATICYNNVQVTYWDWMSPTWHVTDAGTLAGWKFVSGSEGHDKNRLGPCSVYGDSWGTFKQSYPFGVGTLNTQKVVHHLHVWCGGWKWSS